MTSGKSSIGAVSRRRRPSGRGIGLGITLAHAYAVALVVSLILGALPYPGESRSPPPLFSDVENVQVSGQAESPNDFIEEIENRTRTSKRFASLSNPDLRRIEASLSPLHYGSPGAFVDINNSIVPSTANVPDLGTVDLEMREDEFEWYALDTLNTIPLVLFRNKSALASHVSFNPQALQYRNDLDDVSIVSQPAIGVLGQVTNETLLWVDGYGTGRNLSVTLAPNRMIKELRLESAPPAPPQFILDGGNPVLELEFIFLTPSGPNAPDIRVDGTLWDQSSRIETALEVVFEIAGAPLFVFTVPFASDSAGNETSATMILTKQGPNLRVGTRVPLTFLDNATYPVTIDPTVDVQVGAGADDTDTETGSWSNSRTRPDCPGRDNSAGSTPCDASFRWTGVSVPQGALITAATFEPHTFPSGDDGPDVRSNIYAEDADNPTAPTSLADFNGRTRTTAFTAWDGQSFSDAFTVSPDISSVVQEVVDRGGFAGAAFQIFWDDDGSPAPDSHYEHKTYNNAPADGAKLHITFTSPGAVLRFGVFTDAACTSTAISTDADCWSATSGGPGGIGVPTFGENVTLDSNTGTFARMDANLTVGNVTWLNHPFDVTTNGFFFQANGSWSQDSGQINIDVGTPPGGIVVLGDLTLNDSAFIIFDESDGIVDVRGDLLFDDEMYVDVSFGFTNGLISVGGNYTVLDVDGGNWDSTDLVVRLNGTADQTINTTTEADLDLLVLRNGTKILETDYRGVTLRADAGVVNLTVSNLRTVTLGPSGRIENLTLTSDVFGSQYNLTRSGASIRANNSDFQDANGFFVDASTETGNTDSGNNVNVTFRGIAPLTFLNVTWQQGQPDPGDPRFPQYVFFQPSFGATPVPRVQVVPNNDPFDVFVTLHTASNVTFEICTFEAFNELEFTFDGLTANARYRLLRNGIEILNTTTNGAGVWNLATSGESGNWDECPTDVMSLLLVPLPLVVVTVSASATITQAILRGNLTDLGSPAPVGNVTVFFEWGFSIELGFNTTGVNVTTTGQFTALIGDLEAGITYFFRAVAVEGSNRTEGEIVSFTTRAEPLFSARDGLILIMLVFIIALFVLAPIFNIPALWILDGIITILFGVWTFNNLAFPFEFAVAIMALGGVLLTAGVLLTFRLARARRAVV